MGNGWCVTQRGVYGTDQTHVLSPQVLRSLLNSSFGGDPGGLGGKPASINSQAVLFITTLILSLMKADKVTSVLCDVCVVFALFFICFFPYKTHVNRPDAVSIATLSLQAADAGKGFFGLILLEISPAEVAGIR